MAAQKSDLLKETPSSGLQAIWAPFQHRAFAIVWLATVVANTGSWMYAAACSWLMLTLTPDPLMVSLVQVANSLPMFLFAIMAGALVDIVDKRRFMLFGEVATVALSAVFAALVGLNLMTPRRLLVVSFLLASAGALTAPAWQAIVPLLVPKRDLPSAVTTNSLGVNISRAVGPALGGLLINGFGMVAPFAANAVSNLGVIGALIWWREPTSSRSSLPPEHLLSAVTVGLRHACYNRPFADTLVRATGFFLFSSCYWALLPIVSRARIGGGAAGYGALFGAIGASAVCGAIALPLLKRRFRPAALVVVGTIGTAGATVLYAVAHGMVMGVSASLVAGFCWIVTLSTLNISAQIALPDWVRGRGLAIYGTVMFGALTLGSLLWGQVAASFGVTSALLLAAVGAILSIPLLHVWKIHAAEGLDLSPSMYWPTPMLADNPDYNSGPIMVMIRYHIDPSKRQLFLRAIEEAGLERCRDGAFQWRVYQDPAEIGCYVEAFLVGSWLDHLRQHERVTNADRALERIVQAFDIAAGPKATHLVAVRASRATRSASPPP